MNLAALLAELEAVRVDGPVDREIRGIAAHSQDIGSGFLFVAIRGFTHDGHTFIPDAVARHAVAVVVERPVDVPAGVTRVVVPDSRLALGLLSSVFYRHPSQALRVIGVTGTNGKGTTAHLIEAVLSAAGLRCGLIGTLGAKVGDQTLTLSRTTPEAPELHALLRQMVDAHFPYAVMEVASHALALHRVAGCRFHAAVFTNLTQDHLDFHKTFDQYRAAKRRLFEMVDPTGVAVVNADDLNSVHMSTASRAPVVTYGIERGADVRAQRIRLHLHGSEFEVHTPSGQRPVRLRLQGKFNVFNALAAVAVALSQGVSLDVVIPALERFPGVPGRFEFIDEGQGFAVVVDYAHTPDGLENVLRACAEFVSGRTIVVFGCGGDRDRTKRPIMGRIAAALADAVIVTSDNPRSEEPMAIIADIVGGLPDVKTGPVDARSAHGGVQVEPDRRSAIYRAIELAHPGDMVLIAGKGHEPYQEVRGVRYPFDDRLVAREALRQRLQAARSEARGVTH